jgi:hypothetical protein
MATAVTTITIDGQSIALPGAYSTLDTSEAQQPGFDTGKVLAIMADTVGGKPQTLLSFNSLAAVKQGYLFSGLATDLKYNAALMARLAYNASDDDRIAGSFDRIVFVKPGRDLASTGTLQGTAGPLATLAANDYGAHTNQFGYQVGAGTNGGVSMLIVGGTVIEQTGDDIGADAVVQMRYDGPADKLYVDTTPAGPTDYLTLHFEHQESGLETTEIVAGWTAGIATLVSNAGADKVDVTVYGHFGGVAVAETKALDGTTPVDTTQQFTEVTGVRVRGMTTGTVTVKDSVALVVATFAPSVIAITPPDSLILLSSSVAGDTGYPVQLSGETAAGVPIAETVTLLGTASVSTINKFAKLLTVKVIGTTAGTVTITDSAPVTLVSLGAGTDPSAGLDITAGLHVFSPALPVAQGAVSYINSAVKNVVLRGINSSGVSASELIPLASGTTTTLWSSIDHIELGAMPAANNTTLTGNFATRGDETMDELEAGLELLEGMSVVSINGDRKTSELDVYSNIDIKGALTDFYSQAQDVIDFINAGIIMTATRSAGATGLPTLTGTTVLLAGGATVAATNADISAALEVLKEDTSIRAMIPAYTDQSVHLLAKEWANNRALPTSKAETRVYIPLDPTTATKAEIKSLTVALNNERAISTVQRKSYYDDDGILQAGDSIAAALTLGGLRAAASIGEPGTWKYVQGVAWTNDGAWTPEADGDELVRSGLNVVQRIAGRGYRIIRSVTTYQKRADRIRTEESSMESADESARDLRTYTEEKLTGVKNALVTVDTVKNIVEDRLDEQVKLGIITAWRNATVVLVGDIFIIDYEVAPVEPINFIKLQAHVFTVVAAA